MQTTDFLIYGAGPVGTMLALALTETPFQVGLCQQTLPVNLPVDKRMLALSARSIDFLKQLDVWSDLSAQTTKIKQVHISEKGRPNHVLLKHEDYQRDELGVVIAYSDLMSVLSKRFQERCHDRPQQLTHFVRPSFQKIIQNDQTVSLYFHEEETIQARYLLAAEGGKAGIRQHLNWQVLQHDYDQVAVIALITCQNPHEGVAYERFSLQGAMALLPVGTQQMAVIFTVPRDQHQQWRLASDETFITALTERFGTHLGMFSCPSPRQIWPLSLVLTAQNYQKRTLLFGNSAHALHPIAGQGLNLGIRDIIDFIDLLSIQTGSQLLDSQTQLNPELLAKFAQQRQKDAFAMVGATHFLVTSFAIDCLPLNWIRPQILRCIQALPFLKRSIAAFGMGLR